MRLLIRTHGLVGDIIGMMARQILLSKRRYVVSGDILTIVHYYTKPFKRLLGSERNENFLNWLHLFYWFRFISPYSNIPSGFDGTYIQMKLFYMKLKWNNSLLFVFQAIVYRCFIMFRNVSCGSFLMLRTDVFVL